MPRIEFDHPVTFSAADHTAETNVKANLEEFHNKLVEISPTYSRSVKKATSDKAVVVTVTRASLPNRAAAHYEDRPTHHLIAINPTERFNNRPLRSGDGARENEARDSLIFEMQNAASSRQMSAIDERAIKGSYEHPVAGVYFPQVAATLMRDPNDGPAARYAVDVEKQEWENQKNVVQIANDIYRSPEIKNLLKMPSFRPNFEDDLAQQIKRQHTQGYLEDYDFLRKKR